MLLIIVTPKVVLHGCYYIRQPMLKLKTHSGFHELF
jgi:hypothetical protein